MQKLSTFLSVAFLVMLFSIQGCKKENDDTPADLALTTEKGNYFPYELAQLNVIGGKVGNDSLQGEFNGQNITVYAFDSAIVFVVPEVAAGNYTLKVNAPGKTIESPVTVKALTGVQTAETYIQTYTNEVAANIAYAKAKADSMSNSAEATTLRNDADKLTSYMNDLNTQFLSLSPAEKELFAKFMAANKETLDEIHQAVLVMQNDASIASRSGVEDHEKNVEKLMESYAESVKTTVKSIPKAALAILVLKGSAGAGILGVVSAAAAGIYIGTFVSDLLTTLSVMTKLLDMSFVPFQNFTVNNDNYSSGSKTALIASLTYRSIFSNDIQNKLNSVVAKFVNVYDTFKGGYDYVVDKLPSFLKPGSGAKALNSISNYLTKKRQVFGNYFNIKNISNPKVTVQEQKNADGTTDVTFTTTETTKQDFTFEMAYANSKFASDVKTTISASVEPGSSLDGTWNCTTFISADVDCDGNDIYVNGLNRSLSCPITCLDGTTFVTKNNTTTYIYDYYRLIIQGTSVTKSTKSTISYTFFDYAGCIPRDTTTSSIENLTGYTSYPTNGSKYINDGEDTRLFEFLSPTSIKLYWEYEDNGVIWNGYWIYVKQ